MIPSFNEEKTIKKVTLGAYKYCDMVIVVDDGSQDKTGDTALGAGALVVQHLVTLGVGAALSTGFKIALNKGANIVVTIDGDGQHDPNDIPQFLGPLTIGKIDAVLGSRFLGNFENMPFYKRMGNKFLSFTTSTFSGKKITDSQCGFRAYSRKVLESILHESTDYSWASELSMRIMNSEFNYIEVPIRTIYLKERNRGTGFTDGLKIFMRVLKLKREK